MESNSSFEFHSKTELIGNIALRIYFWVIAFVILFGNSYLIVTTTKRILKSKMNYQTKYQHIIVLNIGISDILMGFYLLILSIKGVEYSGDYEEHEFKWRHSFLCYFIGSLAAASRQNTSFLMVLLTSYRLYSVRHVYVSASESTSKWLKIVIFCWVLTLTLVLVPLSFRSNGLYYGNNSACLPDFYRRGIASSYFIYNLVITNIIFCCCLFVAVGYVSIFKFATKRPVHNSGTAKQESVLQRRITRIIVTDFLCAVPICIVSYLSIGVKIPEVFYLFTAAFLIPINSAINPFLLSPLPDKLMQYAKSVRRTAVILQSSIQTVTTAL